MNAEHYAILFDKFLHSLNEWWAFVLYNKQQYEWRHQFSLMNPFMREMCEYYYDVSSCNYS